MKILRSSQGMVLFMVIFVMAFFLIFVTGGLIFSQIELKKSSNFKLAVQALETADAGLQHGLAAIYSGWDFNTNLVTDTCTTPPCPIRYTDTTTGLLVNISKLSFGSTGFSYTVTAQNDNPPADNGGATSDTNKIIVLNSTAYGPDKTTPLKQVQAYVGRSTGSWTPPGAFFFPGTTANTDDPTYMRFSATSTTWRVSGKDTNPGGAEGSGSKPALPAIATNNSAKTAQIVGKIPSNEYSQVAGSGSTPSVVVVPISNTTVDFTPLITNILNLVGAGVVDKTVGTYDGVTKWGTAAAPQVTHVKYTDTGSGPLVLIGNFTGYGILIFESNQSDCCSHLAIGENASFQGLIITRTHVHMDPKAEGVTKKDGISTLSSGTARVYGSIMMQQHSHSSFGIEDTNRLYYSSLALQNYVLNQWGSALPKTAIVRSWVDNMN